MGMHEYTRSPQDYWSNSFRLFLIYFYFFEKLVLLTCFVDIKEKKRPKCFESYKCTLFMSVHVGNKKKKKKAGNVISLI